MEYEIDFEKIKNDIIKSKARNVLVQLPDGLKQDYKEIVKKLKGDYNIFLWGNTCFGACDIPTFTEKNNIDLIVHFGHEEF